MSVYVDDVFMERNQDTLKKSKDKIKPNINIQDSRKVKNFLRVYYEWGRDTKVLYTKTIIKKNVKNLIEGYEKNTGGDVKVQKTPDTPGTTTSNTDLEEPQGINNYR